MRIKLYKIKSLYLLEMQLKKLKKIKIKLNFNQIFKLKF